jgi:DNA repair exonuclease SbcCD ATPase subunit
MMSEREPNLKELLNQLADELRSFKYALSTWQDELNEYKNKTVELNQLFIKLGQLSDVQLKEQNKIFQDLFIKLLTLWTYMDNKLEILCSIENKILNVINDLSITFNKVNDNNVRTMEALNKLAEGQPKTIVLLQDIKSLLSEQLEIRRKEQLERKKIEKKIEQEIGE